LGKVNYPVKIMPKLDKLLCYLIILHVVYFIIAALYVAIFTNKQT